MNIHPRHITLVFHSFTSTSQPQMWSRPKSYTPFNILLIYYLLARSSTIYPSTSHTPYFKPTNFLHLTLTYFSILEIFICNIFTYLMPRNSKLNKLNKEQNYSYLIEVKIIFNTQGNQMRQYFSSQLLFGDSQLLMSKSTFVNAW